MASRLSSRKAQRLDAFILPSGHSSMRGRASSARALVRPQMIRFAILLPMLCAACSSGGGVPNLKPSEGWARETVPGQTSAAAYLTVTNNGTGADTLVSVSSDVASHTMLHATTEENGVTRMRHLAHGLPIPSKTAVELSPGRTHVMLSGLTQPLRQGQTFELTMKFRKSGEKSTAIKVLGPEAAARQEAG